jgi:hypothetical protein
MDIIARTDEFEKGLFKTRKELTAARRVFRKNLDVHDKFAKSLNEADRMLKRGNISLALHRKEVARLTKEYRESNTFSGKLFKGLKGRFTALAISAVSIGTIIHKLKEVRQGIQQIDDLDKAAKGINATVANIQAISFAAGQTAGLDASVATAGIEKMAKRVAEAAMGTGEAASALKELNIDAAKLNKLKPYEQFKFLADAMEAVPHAGTRAALAAKLFDMEARRLHITMRGGAAAIEEYKKQAEEMGILLDDSMVEDATKANDAIGKLSSSWENFKLVISANLAPVFEGAAAGLEKLTAKIGALAKMLRLLSPEGPDRLRRYTEGFFTGGRKQMYQEALQDIAPFVPMIPQFMIDAEDRDKVFNKKVEKYQERSLQGWLMGWKPDRRKFVLKKTDEAEADIDDLTKEEGVKSLKSGMTAEKDSIEEYRFLLEKQQRENQARLTTSNIEALNNNTNAILQTQKRDEIHYPRRSNLREVQLAP